MLRVWASHTPAGCYLSATDLLESVVCVGGGVWVCDVRAIAWLAGCALLSSAGVNQPVFVWLQCARARCWESVLVAGFVCNWPHLLFWWLWGMMMTGGINMLAHYHSV